MCSAIGSASYTVVVGGGGMPMGSAAPSIREAAQANSAANGSQSEFLAQHRAEIMKQLEDPETREKFLGLMQAETGGQGAAAQQAFAEETIEPLGGSKGKTSRRASRRVTSDATHVIALRPMRCARVPMLC